MKKFRPILFSTEMVKAILSDSKVQTRRTKGLEKIDNHYFQSLVHHATGKFTFVENGNYAPKSEDVIEAQCPYGKVGDVLWVRETMILNTNSNTYWPLADGYKRSKLEDGKSFFYEKTVPSIHMPKSACRLFLEIKEIRVERLQDISRGDCMDEGCPFPNIAKETNPKEWFENLWKKINSEESWNSNPWVWAIEFRCIEKPENFI